MTKPKKYNQQLKALQVDWYKKLKESGFKDIESKDLKYLKQWDSHYFKIRNTAESFQIKSEYFYMASQFLNSHIFTNEIEKNIWALHCEGLGFRQISNKIKLLDKTFNKDKINQIVKRLKHLMLHSL
jgi:hypothetical protein